MKKKIFTLIMITAVFLDILSHPVYAQEICFKGAGSTFAMPQNDMQNNITDTEASYSVFNFTDEELDYMARCVISEAGNQEEEGKRLVIDVILNRLLDGGFGENVTDIINAKGQFEVVSNGAINKVKATEEILDLIQEEMKEELNAEVLYFRTKRYHSFGTPIIKCGAHYFSGK